MRLVISASRDLIPIIAALEYNQWFTKLSSKDLRLVSGAELRREGLQTPARYQKNTCFSVLPVSCVQVYFLGRYFPKNGLYNIF